MHDGIFQSRSESISSSKNIQGTEKRNIPGTDGMLLMMIQNMRNIYLHCSSLQTAWSFATDSYGVSQRGESFWERPCLPLNALPVITSHVHALQTRSICRSGRSMDLLVRDVCPVRLATIPAGTCWRRSNIRARERERERVERIKAYVVACICNFCSYVRTPAVQSLAILGRK